MRLVFITGIGCSDDTPLVVKVPRNLDPHKAVYIYYFQPKGASYAFFQRYVHLFVIEDTESIEAVPASLVTD